MRTPALLAPAGLSALLLAAHFLRRGAVLPVAAGLALFALLAVPRPWAAHVLRLGLALGALEWLRTLLALAAERRAQGEPWVRMSVILGAVILVALLAIVLLEHPAVRRHFGRSAAPPV